MAKQHRIGVAVMGLTCSVWLLLAQGVAAQDRPMHMRERWPASRAPL